MADRSHSLPPKYFDGALKRARGQAQPGHEHKYAVQMVVQGRGHALFDPYPGRHGNASGETVRNPCVEIGDVGYVRNGSFRLLFNIHRQAEDASQIHGVPEGFVPLERRPHLVDHRLRPFPRMMHSSTKVAADISAEVAGPGDTQIASSWKLQHDRGASLAYFDRYEVWDAQDKPRYSRYFRLHFRSWLKFIKSMELGLTLKDLVLITGCDRTRAWATLWSESSSSSGSVALQVQTSVGASLKLTGSVQWHNAHSVPSLCGPPAEELGSSTRRLLEELRDGVLPSSPLSEASTQLSPPSARQSLSAVPADQCIFIRGFRGREMFPAAPPFRLRGGGPPPKKSSTGFPTFVPRRSHPQVPGRSISGKKRADRDSGTIEDVLGTPLETVDSLVTVALDLVAEIHKPVCENNILLMHDDDLAIYLPEPGDEQHQKWDSMEAVQSYLAYQLSDHPETMGFLTQVDGDFWVQVDNDAELQRQLHATTSTSTDVSDARSPQSPTRPSDNRAALLKNLQLYLSQVQQDSPISTPPPSS